MDLCLYCSNEIPEGGKYCKTCIERLSQYADAPNVPALHGLSDGPHQGYTCWEKPNPYLERKKAMQAMEDAGRLDTPDKKAKAQAFVDQLKDVPKPKVDYGKDGHPLDSR